MEWRGRAVPVLVFAAVLLAAGRPALADVSATVSSSPGTVAFPLTKEISYRIDVRSGDQPEVFAIGMAPSYYNGPGATEGSPIGSMRGLRVEGDLRNGFAGGDIALPACAPSWNRFHGYEPQRWVVDAQLPPNSSGALLLRREFGEHAPWPDADLRLHFRLTNDLVGPGVGTLEREQELPTPAPARSGPTGVRIDLTTRPETTWAAQPVPNAKITPGTPISVSGSTDPPLAGARIELEYVGPESRERRTLAVLDTDDAGRFELAGWRPRSAGYHELWAFYESDRPSVVDDHMCPRNFELTGPYSPPSGPAKLRIRSRSERLTRAGAVPLRVTCVGGGGCGGTLTLTAPARAVVRRRSDAAPVVLARRRVEVGQGLAQRFEIRLAKRWRAAVRRAGGVRVTVAAGDARRTVIVRR